MKTVKTMKIAILAMAALFTVNTATLAADEVDALISVRQVESSQKKAFIRVTNLSNEASAVLRIKDMDGNTLHREVIADQSYMKKYDFSSMPSGEYEVEVRTKNGVSKEIFQISAGQTNAVYFKPAIQVEPEMVKVAFLNRVESPVSLKLYNQDGKVLYEESVASQETYSKGLNVAKLLPGRYSLAIVGANYTYSKSIDLK
ncbi:hypothetical protein OKW21_005624 [Catalinimonas alkaloidigena]|uniref:hypothetical protein n=1 Tax=Catalinimonas alkaloidigena TaxID=1075417 RepID=UPI0024057E15|nr:hypothetical protein [Catalinimonas alkaloidigena]MDF9800361.1 hypothetical protein [Catalinimonas alkaloidigena]